MPQRGKSLCGAQSDSPAISQNTGLGMTLETPLWFQDDRQLCILLEVDSLCYLGLGWRAETHIF